MKLMLAAALLLSFTLTAHAGADGVRVTLSATKGASGKKAPGGGGLAPGSHTLAYHRAFVTQGSFSGLRLTFRSDKTPRGYLELQLFIPSHGDFAIGFNNREGVCTLRTPKQPFAVTARSTAGVKDRRGRARPLTLSLKRWVKTSPRAWSTPGHSFTGCMLKVERMKAAGKKLTLKGSFTCKAPRDQREVRGTLAIKGVELGSSKVD